MNDAFSRRGWLAAAAVAVSAVGCRRGGTQPVRLGVAALRISLPLFVAIERSLFAEHGVAVEVRRYVTAQPMIDDLLVGRLDAAGFAAYPIVLASGRASSSPIPARMAASLVEDGGHRLSYALARKGSGVAFPSGVRKKRIGILPTIAYRRWLVAILRSVGIDEGEVTIVPVEPPMQAAALADGGVDLLFTNDPMATAILARGDAELVDDGPQCAKHLGDPFPFGGFVLGGAFATDRASDAARLLAAVDAGILATRADPAAARRDMAKHVRPEERAFVDRYPDARFLTTEETPRDAVDVEVAREKELGIFGGEAKTIAWAGPKR